MSMTVTKLKKKTVAAGRTGSRSSEEFAETFPKTTALARHPVRCGKPTCRCAGGAPHESWRLVWRDALGRQRHRYVRRAEVEAVRAVLARRRERARRRRREAEAALGWLREVRATLRELEREREATR